MITDFLTAAKIGEVVWIDDFFATISFDQATAQIEKHLALAKERGLEFSTIPRLATLKTELSLPQLQEAVSTLIEGMTEAEVIDLAEKLGTLVGATAAADTQPDLLPEDFAALRTAFGPTLKTYSLAQWTSAAAATHMTSDTTVLFIVDREFRRESTGMDGLKLLPDLVNRKNSYCILLTHTCSPDDQTEKRAYFAGEAKVGVHQFCVVSKAQAGDSVDKRFARAIVEVFSHLLTGQLAQVLASAIKESTDEAARDISCQNIYDTDRAIFENSIGEGTSEAEVLTRIFRVRQKPRISVAIRSEAAQKALRTVREFRAATEKLRSELLTPKLDLPIFRTWRKEEIFDDPATLNLLHSPLACGDLFEVTPETGPKVKYVLIAQPCDLTVRGTGERMGDIGMLVPIAETELRRRKPAPSTAGTTAEATPTDEEESDDEDESPYKFFDIKGVAEGERVWRVDLRKTMFVPLEVLDLAVYNSDGALRLQRDHPEPNVVLLPGWQERLNKAKRWFPAIRHRKSGPLALPPPPSALPAAAIGKGSSAFKLITITNTELQYSATRCGRIDAPVANATLAAWSIYQTRAAFDHDFARPMKRAKSSPPQDSPPPAVSEGSPAAAAPQMKAPEPSTDSA